MNLKFEVRTSLPMSCKTAVVVVLIVLVSVVVVAVVWGVVIIGISLIVKWMIVLTEISNVYCMYSHSTHH